MRESDSRQDLVSNSMTDAAAMPATASAGVNAATTTFQMLLGNDSDLLQGNVSSVNGSAAADDGADDAGYVRSIAEIVIISILLCIVILTTICGNLLVCITIITNRRLRNPTNFFLLSLAAGDLMLGVLVLPFSAVNTLASRWPMGPTFCNIFTSFDVMLCTVSILTLFAISLDRYFAVNMPLRYQQKMNSKIVTRTSIAIWIFSLLMAFVPIHVGWNTPDGKVQNYANPDMCVFDLNKPYVLLVSIGTYFTPLIVMCAVYLKVLRITKHQVREINRLTRTGSNTKKKKKQKRRPSKAESADVMLNGGERANHNGGEPRHVKNKNAASDTKATVTLASVVLAYAICWVPYFALFTAKPFVSKPFNMHLELFFLWLGYVNSLVNPFLYAFYNSSFRDGFKKVLHLDRFNRRKHALPHLRTRRSGSSSETSEMSVLRQNTCVT